MDDYLVKNTEGRNGSPNHPTDRTENSNNLLNETPVPVAQDVVIGGKENVRSKRKPKATRFSKEKKKPEVPCNEGLSDVKPKRQRKKSLRVQKQGTEEKCAPQEGFCSSKDDENLVSLPSVALKLKMKSKEASDCDTLIEEFNSPEQVVPVNNPKDAKSPQGSMLQYLIRKNSPGGNEPPTENRKINRNISDFFSPSKQSVSGHLANSKADKKDENKSEILDPDGFKGKKSPGKEEIGSSITLKSTKQSKSHIPVSKKDGNGAVVCGPASAALNFGTKSSCKASSKSGKKSLSLSKVDSCGKDVQPSSPSVENQVSDSDVLVGLTVVQSISHNWKKIMSKPIPDVTEAVVVENQEKSSCKKRKRGDNDNCSDVVPKLSKFTDDSPVKSKRKLKKTNQIDSDSDDNSTKMSAMTAGDTVLVSESANSDPRGEAMDVPEKVEESKRNSLMNYFAKVSKEEALEKEEKIQMKVKVMVHSPPTTPTKKLKRRSIHSLPGGVASLTKRKVNQKNKLKENVNAIEVIDVEEVRETEKNNKDFILEETNLKQETSASVKCQPRTSPRKRLTLSKSVDSSDINTYLLNKSPKGVSIKGKSQQDVKTKPVDFKAKKSDKCGKAAGEDNLATPLNSIVNDGTAEFSSPKQSWKMRVCLTPGPLPTTQGTFHEEESDCDEIFSTRSDKKRKIESYLIQENPKEKETSGNASSLLPKCQSPDIIVEKEKTSSRMKIAPLFTRKIENQARQLFLQSGVPEQARKVLEIQHSFDEQEAEIFPKQSHIQQNNDKEWVWNLSPVTIPLKDECAESVSVASTKFSLSALTGCYNIKDLVDYIKTTSSKGPEMRTVCELPLDVMKPILRLIKRESPEFKVADTFKLLRSKMRHEEFSKAAALSAFSETERPKRKSTHRKSVDCKSLFSIGAYRANVWTEKYKPSTASEIVGNSTSIVQLKRWLEMWRKASDDISRSSCKEESKRKKKRKDAIDDDEDFMASDNSSDREGSNLPVGVAILHGPHGCGKTSAVYALAKDLGYKVLEVNASEKRNGKSVLSKLSEATQSHQVHQGSTVQQSFAALFGNNSARKQKSKPKTEQEDDKAKKMSLILFEDVDIVFEEEDEGFLSAISNLVSSSKRPVIITTTDPESSMVHRFMNSSSLILKFNLAQNLLSTWLQIVSIIEGIYVAPGAVKELVSVCKGDFRRAMLQMQLWVNSGGNNLSMPSIAYSLHSLKSKKGSKSDEAGDFSDFEGDKDCSPSIPANTDCLAAMVGNIDTTPSQENETKMVKVPFPLDLGSLWWNLPPILSFKQIEHLQLPAVKEEPCISSKGPRKLLDDSFIANFCTDDASSVDSGMTEDSDTGSSQGTHTEENLESQGVEILGDVSSQTPLAVEVEPSSYKSCSSHEEMRAMLNQMGSLSIMDVISAACKLSCSSDKEPIFRFSCPTLKDSLLLNKSEEEGPNWVLSSTAQEISHWLAEESLNVTVTQLHSQHFGSCVMYNYCLPSVEEQRWRTSHADTEQQARSALPLCVQLEYKAVSTDYMPTLRTICRLEKNRSIINTKRRNRFYHYLKSLGMDLTEVQYEVLCHTWC